MLLSDQGLSNRQLSRQARIAIIRALPGLGDFLCAVPAWRALRTALPEGRLTLIGLPVVIDLTRRFRHYLDEFRPFPGFAGILEGPSYIHELPLFLATVRANPFDVVLQMHGDGKISNMFAMMLDGHVTAGSYLPGHMCPDPNTFLPYPEDESEIWRLLRLVEFLGYPLQGDELEFPIEEPDEVVYDHLAHSFHIRPGDLVCLHPGASRQDRRLPPAAFAAIGDRLSRLGYRVALTGTAPEAVLTAAVAGRMRHPALDLAGRTTLGALALLMRNAALVVSNDTGISHLAAAMRTPSVIVFINSDPRRWAPLDRMRHRVIDWRGRTTPNVNDDPSIAELAEAVAFEAAIAHNFRNLPTGAANG